MTVSRELKYHEAIREALDLKMTADPSVFLLGLGVPDPKGVFGTTSGLQAKHGAARVMDMPTSENAMTGVVLGAALAGMRPVLTHQRLDFAVLTLDQIVNQAAKWHYMFGGKASAPFVVRMVVGRGWGQGPQHSQNLHAWFAHVPGLKVVMPTTPHDAKGLLVSAIEDPNPVIYIENRWLHNITGPVPEGLYRVPIGQARVAREGADLTIVSSSYMTLEALRAADILAMGEVEAEVIDLRSIRPIDWPAILGSVRKTGRLLVADTGWKTAGFAAEVVARVSEEAFASLKAPPRRVALPDVPAPTSPALSDAYYPHAVDILRAAMALLDKPTPPKLLELATPHPPFDVPDPTFTGPF